MAAYPQLQQRKKAESKRLRGERYQIKFIDLAFERWQVVASRKSQKKARHSINSMRDTETKSRRKNCQRHC